MKGGLEVEDKLQSRCSRIGRRNTLWRPTKMSSPTVNCPRPSEREQKKSKPPHRASTRQPAARCSTGRGDADPGGAAERRSADSGQLGRAPAPCGSGHRPQRRAVGHPAASSPAPSAQRQGGHGHGRTGPEPARGTRHPAPGLPGAARGAPSAAAGRGGARARAGARPVAQRPGAQRQGRRHRAR